LGLPQERARSRRLHAPGARVTGYSIPHTKRDMVSPSEGNEAKREGRREVLAP
jgi:hypothetical protein